MRASTKAPFYFQVCVFRSAPGGPSQLAFLQLSIPSSKKLPPSACAAGRFLGRVPRQPFPRRSGDARAKPGSVSETVMATLESPARLTECKFLRKETDELHTMARIFHRIDLRNQCCY